jgi:mRNA interferase RelE/StbE
MPYEIGFSSRAAKDYDALTPDMRQRVDQKLDYLRVSPRGHDTKKLQGGNNLYRTRVGAYRIIYEINDAMLLVWILRIGKQDSIYK